MRFGMTVPAQCKQVSSTGGHLVTVAVPVPMLTRYSHSILCLHGCNIKNSVRFKECH